MASEKTVIGISSTIKNDLVPDLKSVKTATDDLYKSLSQVLGVLQKIENQSLGNIKNKAKTVSNNFKMPKSKYSVVGSQGAMFQNGTGKTKTYQDFEQTVLDTQKAAKDELVARKELSQEIREDTKERKRLRSQYAAANSETARARTTTANARMLAARKAEDRTTSDYAAFRRAMTQQMNDNAGMRQFRSRHPEMFAAGGQNWNWRYQTARALSGMGNAAMSLGVGGRVGGDILQVIGAFFKSPWAGTATAITKLTSGVTDLGKAAVQAFSQIESIKTQLGVVFSNQTQADDMFSQISQYAIKSPFGVQQTSELAVLLKQSGVNASDLMDTLKMLGDTASGNMEKMKRIANNYAQIMAIGKASMLDMRQFAYAGIPIFEAVSEELKVSQQELRKMISDGKVTSDIIEKVFKNLTGINGIFENATEKGAKTLKARLQNLADARQLAFSSFGERLVYTGAKTGNDSVGLRLVSWAEKMFSWWKEHSDLKNIERDVNLIASSDLRIEALEQNLEYARQLQDKSLEKLIQTEINNQKKVFTPDKRRSIYSTSYDLKTQEFERYKDLLGIFTTNNIQSTISEYQSKAWDLRKQLNYDSWGPQLTDEQKNQMEEQIKIYNSLADELKQFEKSIQKSITVIEEERKAHKEKLLIDAQQLAYDQNNKSANASGSLNTSFEELYSLYKDSDEYKEKTEKERIKRLEEAKAILNKIAQNTDESGTVNLSNYKGNVKELYTLIKRGAFSSGQSLDVVTGDNKIDSNNKNLLLSQLDVIASAIQQDFRYSLNSSEALKPFTTGIKELRGMSSEKFYDSFSYYFSEMQNSLEILEKNSPSKSVQENIQMYKELLPLFLSTLTAETEGRFANPSASSGTSEEFIPLWKRILAQGTGLSAQGMTSTAQTLGNYQNDMAIRNLASGVISAAFQSTSLSKVMSLMRSNEIKQLRGDTGGTYQINWQETKKAMHDFATQLSASTDVITAYKKGLEDELNTYQQLVAAGYTQAESQDIKNQKLVSTKTMSKLVMDAGDQLVNAFGEEFVTASGQKAYLHDDGQFYDAIEGGNKIQEEELKLTGNLFRMIEQRLGQLYSEIHEANAAELNNAALGKMLSDVAPTAYMSTIMKAGTSAGNLRFLASNQEYISKFIDTKINYLKNDDSRFKLLGKLSNDDIIMKALNGNTYVEELIRQWSVLENKIMSSDDKDERKQLTAEQDVIASKIGEANDEMKLLIEVFKSLDQNVSDLTGDETFTLLYERLKGIKKEGALNTAVSNLLGAYSIENTPKYLQNIPENYEGSRGTRNWLLKALGWNTNSFDKEDLYVAAAKGGYFKNDPYYQTANGTNFFEGLSDETIINLLGDADKKSIDLAYNFERIAQAIDDMNVGLAQSLDTFAQGAYLAPMEQLGEWLVKDNDYAEGLKDKMKSLGSELLSQMGTYMAKAGFSLVAMGAETWNWGLITGGLALAAAGGFASGLGNALKDNSKAKDEKDKQAQKLENLKNDLQKLLEQARTDALYYENNLRHSTALGINKDFSYKSVHDAVITKKGDVITTDPRDYLFATKNPQQLLGGGNVTVAPVINCNVVNNSSANVRQEQTQNPDGSIDILTIIEDTVGDYIASSKSDDAFNAREYRIKGRQAIM